MHCPIASIHRFSTILTMRLCGRNVNGSPHRIAPGDNRSATGPNIPQQLALCLFRATQEALRNVGRHAKAKSAEVSLQQSEDSFELQVHDDGVGFNPTLRDRAVLACKRCGGTFIGGVPLRLLRRHWARGVRKGA